jgi:hypothetical protein
MNSVPLVALDPSASTPVGIMTPNVAGANVTLKAQGAGGSIGQVGPTTKISKADYQDTLQRDVDPTGRPLAGQALAAGMSRATLASTIFGSPEYHQDGVRGYYRDFLDRDADPTGLLTWVKLLKRRGRGDPVIAAIAASDEYFGRY